MSRNPKWRIWLDRELEPRWVESLTPSTFPEEAKAMLDELKTAMEKRPVVLGPDIEIRVQS